MQNQQYDLIIIGGGAGASAVHIITFVKGTKYYDKTNYCSY